MNGLFNYPGAARIPRMPTRQREQIPQQPGRQQAMSMPQGMPQMGQPGMMGGSQGLFNAYMQQLFKQKYAPQPMQGGVQNMGGFFGFGSPKMNPIQAAPQMGGLMSPQSPSPQTNHYAAWQDTGG
jgi:hypothetical protein